MAAVVEDFEGRYDEVTGRVAELMGVINAANGELVSLLGEALDDGLWDVWGIHSSGHWTGWQTGMAPGRAKAIVRIAERRHELPTAVAALQAGSLSVDAAVEIAKRAPAGYEHDITEFAKQATIGQLRRSLRDYAYDDETERAKPKFCDSSLRATIWDGTTPLNVGRKTRVISRWVRRAIEHRDGGCRVPGCGRITGLEIHHTIHWEHNGPTDTANLVCLCRVHHRSHHKGHLGISGNADLATDLTFTDPWDHVMAPCGNPVCPDADASAAEAAASLGIVPVEDYDHPLGERMQTWGVHFNENPPPPDPPPPSGADPGGDDGPGGGAGGPGPVRRAGHRAPPSDLPVDRRDGGPPTASSPPAA